MIKDMLLVVTKTIVDKPEKVIINEVEGDKTSIIEIKVDKSDLGKMIGRGGKCAQSIRNLVYAASFKFGKRYTIEIQDI